MLELETCATMPIAALHSIAIQIHPFYNRMPGGGLIYICMYSVFLSILFQMCTSGFYTNPIPPTFVKGALCLSLLEPLGSGSGLLSPISSLLELLAKWSWAVFIHSNLLPCSLPLPPTPQPGTGTESRGSANIFPHWKPYLFFFSFIVFILIQLKIDKKKTWYMEVSIYPHIIPSFSSLLKSPLVFALVF